MSKHGKKMSKADESENIENASLSMMTNNKFCV